MISPGERSPRGPDPEASGELFFRALEDEDAGRLSEAQEKYEQVLAAIPDHVDALVNLGTILYLTGHEPAATTRYLQALALNPDHAEANYNLANLMEGQGELDAAILFYKRPSRWSRSSPRPTSTWPWSWRPWGITAAPGITGGVMWNWSRRASDQFIRRRLEEP